MEFDLQDPLAISFKQDQTCTIKQLFASECDHMASLNHKNVSFRYEVISLIQEVQFSCHLDPFTAYLAINYMDRFISKQEIPGKLWAVKLLAVSCLSLASKMKNIPFSLGDFQKECCIFEARTIHRMEFLILDALKWRMRSITPLSFLDFFISLTELKDPQLIQALKHGATELILNTHYDMKFLDFKPSTAAASAIITAAQELFPLQFSSLRASILSCSFINEETLIKCFKMMQKMTGIKGCDLMFNTCFSSTKSPVSVLPHCHCNQDEGESTAVSPAATTTSVIMRSEERDVKRQKLDGVCYENTFLHSQTQLSALQRG